jgi:hypothetical protein
MAVAQQIASEYGNQQLEPEHVIAAYAGTARYHSHYSQKLVLIYRPGNGS